MYLAHKVSTITPTFNEEKNIWIVVAELPKKWVDEIIVADNSSTDLTREVAKYSGAHVVVREKRRGYGITCQRGIRAVAKDTDIVVFIDGDLSDYPEQIDRLLEPIANGKADMVIGSRILGNAEPESLTKPQKYGNWLCSFLIALFFFRFFTDMGPFRAVRYSTLKRMKLRDPDFGWNVEMLIKALQLKQRVVEVPVDYRKRKHGQSKISEGTFKEVSKIGAIIIKAIFYYTFFCKDLRGR